MSERRRTYTRDFKMGGAAWQSYNSDNPVEEPAASLGGQPEQFEALAGKARSKPFRGQGNRKDGMRKLGV